MRTILAFFIVAYAVVAQAASMRWGFNTIDSTLPCLGECDTQPLHDEPKSDAHKQFLQAVAAQNRSFPEIGSTPASSRYAVSSQADAQLCSFVCKGTREDMEHKFLLVGSSYVTVIERNSYFVEGVSFCEYVCRIHSLPKCFHSDPRLAVRVWIDGFGPAYAIGEMRYYRRRDG